MPSKLGIALRRKYKTPREVLAKLGLDQSLLSIKRLGVRSAKHWADPGHDGEGQA